jgi:AcrR family transcriptional regulator
MQNFTEKIQNTVLEDKNFDPFLQNIAENGVAVGETAELDPKLARREAVNDMKKSHILDAAQRVIVRNGIANVRIEDVADEAGFSKASIYHYFPDKDALLINIVIREQKAVYDVCIEIVERDMSFIETVREFMTALYEKFWGNIQAAGSAHGTSVAMISSFIASMTKHNDLLGAAIASKRDIFNLFVRVVARAKESGELTVPVDSETVAMIILSFLQSITMEMLSNNLCETGVVNPAKLDHGTALGQLFVFLQPWIKDGNQNRRWYDVQQNT